eukprot:CAMPEP_0182500664 /NCGR_PEP_ID=MMETSP1321-20130603/9697_1 /TAXON_ID=91990 /ORGANISM="Bolidomonas sp., Strain RCC1657" /LENGTH=248 /DNA_ID=CAMNT_0024705163 /DNA_START=34 /DNA_END=777 /DNA_ORIENTATION=+
MTSYLSLAVSLLTTGFISATISYDFDTDPQKRAFNPEFYGYVPDDGRKRAFLFATMILLSATQILIKALLIIVLASIGSRFPVYYILGDMAFYLLYKIVRKDFTYWLPLEGVVGMVTSVFQRVICKVVVDFAAIIQFRHPYEVGGLYFSLNMFLPLLALTLLLALDLAKGNLSESTLALLTSLVTVLGGSLIFLLGAFLLLMDKEYWQTFMSTETGGQMKRRMFLEGNDAMKASVFASNKGYRKPIDD